MANPSPALSGLDRRSRELRREVLRIVQSARRGHIISALSLIEMLRVLYDDILRVDPARPDWPDRDRFILSKGHGCLALYAILADRGFFGREHLPTFSETGSILGGHPQLGKVPGVEASTGSLGHGLPIGVGFALAARLKGQDYRTFVLMGDGELDEGSVWEAAMLASKHRLESLTAMVDYNKMQCYGPTAVVLSLEPLADKWRSFGFAVREVDGHDLAALRDALGSVPFEAGRPSTIICHTVKGKGVASIEGNAAWHHKSKIPDEEMDCLMREIDCGCD